MPGFFCSKYELVTCHTARRSFATNGYLSDVPIRDLMQITGHTSMTALESYLRDIDVELPNDYSDLLKS